MTVEQRIRRMSMDKLLDAIEHEKAALPSMTNNMVKGCTKARIRKMEAELDKRVEQSPIDEDFEERTASNESKR